MMASVFISYARRMPSLFATRCCRRWSSWDIRSGLTSESIPGSVEWRSSDHAGHPERRGGDCGPLSEFVRFAVCRA